MKIHSHKPLRTSWNFDTGFTNKKTLRKCDVMQSVEKARTEKEARLDPRPLGLNANGTVVRLATSLPVKIARLKRAKGGKFHAVGIGEFEAGSVADAKKVLKSHGFTGYLMGAIRASV